MDYITITIPVTLWHIVDGSIDNSVAVDIFDFDVVSIANGSCVRDAGWREAALYDGELNELGWPPDDYPMPIVLRREHWEWILTQLPRWGEFDDDTDLKARTAEVAALIGRGLSE